MRITNRMMQRATLSQMQGNMQRIADAQQKVSSGRSFQKASEDPSAAAGAMRARGSLRALEQYKRGVETAVSRAGTEETVLAGLSDLLSRARELAVSQAGANAGAQTRSFTKAEVDGLFRSAIGMANTRFDGVYLFGGNTGDTAPFTAVETGGSVGYTSSGSTGQPMIEIGEKQLVPAGLNATQVFQDTGALDALKKLSDALGANDPSQITDSLADLERAFSGVQDHLGDVGTRVNRLEAARANLQTTEVNLLAFKSGLEDVDFEEAVTELVGRQTALQAAMLATSRVMGLTLADYLR